ncbi:restriction endonuclease subunit S [Streptomyces sp. NPDC093808]|uniref:restriction endonuclease subunit S n=1 Tax=Streptomyces sp. NPDC093808 TaxID=3154985 RepID=UPI00344B85B7
MSTETREMVPLRHYLTEPPRNGFSPVESAHWTGVQLLGLGCLTPDGFSPRQLKNAPLSVNVNHPAILRDGDLLMSRANTRELVGLVGRYRNVGSPCIYPDLMMRLRTAENCLPEFLELLLRSPWVRQQIMRRAQGTSESMVKISADAVQSIIVPDVCLEEQYRIIHALKTVTDFERFIEELTRKWRVIRLSIWDNFERNPKDSWRLCKLTDVVRLPTGQVDPTRAPYRNQQLLAPDHIEPSSGRTIARLTAEEQGAVSGKYLVRPGDVVLSKIRPSLRKVVVADFEGTCSADMYPLRPAPTVSSDYLLAALLGSRFSDFSEKVSGRTGIPKLNRDDLDGYFLVIPPLGEQKGIVEILEGVLEVERSERVELEKISNVKSALVAGMLGKFWRAAI